MKVFKFGGASVKDAIAVRNVAEIIRLFDDDLVVIISAMGKNTNALEEVVSAYLNGEQALAVEIAQEIINFHNNIINELEIDDDALQAIMESIYQKILIALAKEPSTNYHFEYDQIVSFGEILSTTIISGYLNSIGIRNVWFDARKLVLTDNSYREGKVNWDKTAQLIQEKVAPYLNEPGKSIAITQGFIGHTDTNQTTTLGREGSDFSAAIFAWCLESENVTIWKDVPGMLNADPKYFNNCLKLNVISYREAIELSYYGASVIHPKTIKPLQNKHIPLFVKSFIAPKEEGTVIHQSTEHDDLIPSYIFKKDQILMSISPRDFSFIEEGNLRDIFSVFHSHSIKINLMQNSAISFSVCIDNKEDVFQNVVDELSKEFTVKYNKNVELLTIRHYNENVLQQLTSNKEILVHQKTRHTARLVMK